MFCDVGDVLIDRKCVCSVCGVWSAVITTLDGDGYTTLPTRCRLMLTLGKAFGVLEQKFKRFNILT